MVDSTRVLVVGPRNGLCAALRHEDVPYAVWSERSRRHARAEFVHVAPIPARLRDAREAAAELVHRGPFTHVIAGGEASVVPAAVARRVLHARRSPQTTVIRCHDKLHMKRHLVRRGIPMTPFLDGSAGLEPERIIRELGLPVVLKSRTSHGGRDLEFLTDPDAVVRAKRRGRLLERYVDAPEISVESFVNGGEILFESVTEYVRKTHVNVVPAKLDEALLARVLELSRRTIRALAIRWGMTHLEMYLTGDGPLFGEIALRPPGGYIMDLLRLAWGFDPWRAYAAVELDRPFRFPTAPVAAAGAMVLHPGEGTVRRILGLERLRDDPAVTEFRIRIREGDRIEHRTGVGEDVGHVLLRESDPRSLRRTIRSLEKDVRFELVSGTRPPGTGLSPGSSRTP